MYSLAPHAVITTATHLYCHCRHQHSRHFCNRCSSFTTQELARLWDWQQRRAALGLAPDIPLTATPTAAAAAVDDAVDAQAAAAEEAAALQAAAEEAAAAAQAEREAAAAAAAAAEAEAAAAEAEEALAAADVADKGVTRGGGFV